MNEFKSGVLLDTRTEEEKAKDFKSTELIASFAPVSWTTKTTFRKFPIFNQDGSGSCVAQAQAKEIGILRFLKDGNYVHFSASDIYQRRENKPETGMGVADVRKIAKDGVTLEALSPSQNLNDAQMDGVTIEPYKREVGKIFSVPNYLNDPIDIEAVASVIQETKKGVMLLFFFKIDEWTNVPEVKYPTLTKFDGLRHCICAVDFTLYQGKKALVIEDSWGSSYGMAGQRIITEDFFNQRCFYAGHLINFVFDEVPKPSYNFTKDLSFGQTDPDIVALQDILKYEKLFPSNTASTGYYGAVTAKAVFAFQNNHGIDPSGLAGKKVGVNTRAKLNELY